MKKILLTTLNGRYTHSSLALRYIKANLKEYEKDSIIKEFVINQNLQTIAEEILALSPYIIGIGVYIWNATDISNLISIIKKISPSTYIVLGGPEASYQPFRVDFSYADFIISGEGEESFYNLIDSIVHDTAPKDKFIVSKQLDLSDTSLPYHLYTEHDLAHRYTYVEASRGCPFRCEFCLSSIDKKVRYFDYDKLLESFEILWQRGARNFKFIDRTFNLNIELATRLMEFFLSKKEKYTLHFEVIPEKFPDELKSLLREFPPHTLQLEIGIQTLNKDIAKNINRSMNYNKIVSNIEFLEKETHVHLHLDLIVGLPNESLQSFGKGLNRLASIADSEIQIGILKKLSGTTLNRHDKEHGMIYSDQPPYDILQNNLIDFATMQHMKRFARFWDMVYNSGNFKKSITYIYNGSDIFGGFYEFTKWIYSQTQSTHKISQTRLIELVYIYLTESKKHNHKEIATILANDLNKKDGKGLPKIVSKEL
jgi:radical SAM superfamily enzyme YgiQ (UPF0313 family)